MQANEKVRLNTIIDRNKLMELKKCAACDKPFNLGDPVVMAQVSPNDPPTLIHENEAVYDKEEATYVERSLFQSRQRG